jgi:hypothetical protein
MATSKSAKKTVPVKKFSAVETRLQSALAQVKKLSKKLAKTEAKLEIAAQTAATSAGRSAADVVDVAKKVAHTVEAKADHAVVSAKKTTAAAASTAKTTIGTPDASWTVAELRTYSKNKGIAGYSAKTKAQLLEAIAADK